MSCAFGDKLRQQMEERLQFLATGAKPKKNTDCMKEVIDELKAEGLYHSGAANVVVKKDSKKDKKDSKKRQREEVVESDSEEEKPKKKKAKK